MLKKGAHRKGPMKNRSNGEKEEKVKKGLINAMMFESEGKGILKEEYKGVN